MGVHFKWKDWHCHFYDAPNEAMLVVVPLLEGDGATLLEACRALDTPPFHLLCLNHAGWNDFYAPWPLPSPFEKGVRFKGEGAQALAEIVDGILPELEQSLSVKPTGRALVGYSMAGLFALYGALSSEAFQMGASVSGSLWAEGLEAFLQDALVAPVGLTRFYLSLGSKERKTRNPVLAPLYAQTETAVQLLAEAGVDTTFVLNPGNHFTEPEMRTARAIAWLLAHKK